MKIKDRIRELSKLPPRYNIMLEHALNAVSNHREKEELAVVACIVSSASWRYWQAWRPPEDNGQQHEWIVFANVMKIAESENLSLPERRIATAFCFTHDTFFIKRIMENDIDELRKKGLHKEADKLNEMKGKQRKVHMYGGAKNAAFLLKRLKHPDDPTTPLLSRDEIKTCFDIIKKHDAWKMDPPEPPSSDNRLAVTCLEGDALWPMHPIGVLADLERPKKDENTNKDITKDYSDPSQWYEQLKQSLRLLVEFRPKWEEVNNSKITKEDFIDDDSIFRTNEGHRLYIEWRKLWNL